MRGTQQISDPRFIKLVIWGAKGVGKSALIVRFLTRRFIGEYLSGREITYQHEVNLSGEWITAEICDALPCTSLHKHLSTMTSHPDAYVIVYSVSERESFEYACSLMRDVRRCYNEIQDEKVIPVVLVGNKSDLDHLREVSYVEGAEASETVTACSFAEASAAESFPETEELFKGVFRLARTNNILTARAKEGIRSRRPSLKDVALMIKDHCKRQQSTTGEGWGKRKGEAFSPKLRKQSLTSKCKSVGALSELGSEGKSPLNDRNRNSPINKGLRHVHSLTGNGGSVSADEVSSPEDEFQSVDGGRRRPTSLQKSGRFSRKSSLKSQSSPTSRARKKSLNKNNLSVTLQPECDNSEKEPAHRPPQSAPVLVSPSGSRFRFFPNVINEEQMWNGNSPISPLLSRGKTPHHTPSPSSTSQAKQKSPTQNILRNFFKSSPPRNSGSTSSLQSLPSISVTEDNDEDADSSDDQPPIYFRASSSSLSSIPSNEADPGVTWSAPTSPRMGSFKGKSRRTSFREVVSDIMKKRK
ncbi:uncharacterized protein LOC100186782 [Ciona intestinalis]